MAYRKVLITGAFGFIGTNLAINWLMEHPEDRLILMDGMTYAARPDYLRNFIKETQNEHKVVEVICDIRNRKDVSFFIQRHKPDIILHLAAESHVCRSIKGPEDFIDTNIVGTFNLLEAFRKLLEDYPFNTFERKFVHVSTDEVFGELELHEEPFHENSAIKPRSPYAASKASSDHLAFSYFHTYGLPVVVTNCSNNFGPNQHEEKLIPATILRLLKGEKARLYGNGKQIRDWLWVQDHCEALTLLALRGIPGERYCIGGETEKTNQEIVFMLADLIEIKTGRAIKLEIEYTNDRPTDDKRYAINCEKLKKLGWKSSKKIEDNLAATIDFYMSELKLAGLLSGVEGVNDAQ